MTIEDAAARQQAIDISQSFIVQAPAGSGKTEILTQRYLNLLANAVNNPEEAIAITFTRKAAAEMQQRILSMLQAAMAGQVPNEPHKQFSYSLAEKVIAKDQQLNWNILQMPQRLKILTIDSLCAAIVARSATKTRLGFKPDVTENAWQLYFNATTATIDLIEEDNTVVSDSLSKLLLTFGNNYKRLQDFLISMLQQREQWLPLLWQLKTKDIVDGLRSTLNDITLVKIAAVKTSFPLKLQQQLLTLGTYAATGIAESDSNSAIINFTDYNQIPSATIDSCDFWLAALELLLTANGDWRKTVTAKQGFMAPSSAKTKEQKQLLQGYKQQMLQFLADLSIETGLHQALLSLKQSLDVDFNQNDIDLLHALAQVLPILTAQLLVQFKQQQQVDFVEMAILARQLIQNDDEIALFYDYQIKHFLIDEFQDTSIGQLQLLQLLTQQWSDDGRTIFIVGDPMQSIYRFRQAEVGIFLQLQQGFLNNIRLTPLILTTNFRSSNSIVTWINQAMKWVMPPQADINLGAVNFVEAIANSNRQDNTAINFHFNETATEITNLIATISQQQPDKSIAVLARSRRHLLEIIHHLRERQIKFEAIDIETLFDKPIIQDLLNLTAALLHLGDDIAWASLLHSPLCGLCINDIEVITTTAGDNLYNKLENLNGKQLPELSLKRLHKFKSIITKALNNQYTNSIATWIETAWLALGGEALLQNKSQEKFVQEYFNIVADAENKNNFITAEDIKKALISQYANSNDNGNIKLMTIHKSKGLEFDVVIIPSIEAKTPKSNKKLLIASNYLFDNGNNQILLAPYSSTTESKAYKFLEKLEEQRLNFELQRLLYVALTRAKSQLHLFADINTNDDNEITPAADNSFLAMLWQSIYNDNLKNQITQSSNHQLDTDEMVIEQKISRLPLDYKPEFSAYYLNKDSGDNLSSIPPLTLESESEKIGKVVHKILEGIPKIGFDNYCNLYQQQNILLHNWKNLLNAAAICDNQQQILNDIYKIIGNALTCKEGKWVLSAYAQHHTELELFNSATEGQQQFIIDRFFIDNDIGWVVDYKTARPKNNQNIEDFLQQQVATYQQKLTIYSNLVATKFNLKQVKAALFFPAIPHFIEIPVGYQGIKKV